MIMEKNVNSQKSKINSFESFFRIFLYIWVFIISIFIYKNISELEKSYKMINKNQTLIITSKSCENWLKQFEKENWWNNYCWKKQLTKYFWKDWIWLNLKIKYYENLWKYEKEQFKNENEFPIIIIWKDSYKSYTWKNSKEKNYLNQIKLNYYLKKLSEMKWKKINFWTWNFVETNIWFWEIWKENLCNDWKDNNWDWKIDQNDPTCKKAIVITNNKLTWNNLKLFNSMKNNIFWYYFEIKEDKNLFNKLKKSNNDKFILLYNNYINNWKLYFNKLNKINLNWKNNIKIDWIPYFFYSIIK